MSLRPITTNFVAFDEQQEVACLIRSFSYSPPYCFSYRCKNQVSGATRARVAVISGLVVLSYVMLVYLIFYLTYSPLDVDHVRGVQGRYFVIVLPVTAIFVATVMNRELPSTFPSAIAITGSVIAGVATVESLFRTHL